MRTARAYWAISPHQGEIRAEEISEPGPGEVMVRTLYSGISRGSEAVVAAGDVPPNEHERMRCPFQAGRFPFPVKYGYCNVGVIESGVSERIGDTAFCLFPHQDRYIVPATAAFALPPDLPPARAVLAANMETALNGLWDSGAAAGDRITVIGAGVVGLLTAWLAQHLPGSEVRVLEKAPERREGIEALGLMPGSPKDCDVVIDCTGAPEALPQALDIVADHGLVLLLGWHGKATTTLGLGGRFHSGRLTIKSSQVGSLPPDRARRWDHPRRLAKALDLLTDARFDLLLTNECAFGDLPRLLPDLARGKRRALCQLVRYD